MSPTILIGKLGWYLDSSVKVKVKQRPLIVIFVLNIICKVGNMLYAVERWVIGRIITCT